MVEQNGGGDPGDGLTETSVSETGDKVENKPNFMTNEQFDAAIKRRESALEKKFEKKLAELTRTQAPKVDEDKELSRTAVLEKRLQEMTKREQDRDLRERDSSLRNKTINELHKAGIAPEYSEHALAYLVDAKKMIRYSEDGNPVMQVGLDEFDDLAAGIQFWANTKEAKLYKLPSGTSGSGDGKKTTQKTITTSSGMPKIERNKDGSMTRTTKIDFNNMLKSALK